MLRDLLAIAVPVSAMTVVGVAHATTDANTNFNDYRGLWVTRYEYKYQDAAYVNKIMRNAKLMGLNNISFQVRGSGDAYYNSNYESKAISWDALDAAVGSAHSYNMKLHAYINTMPMMEGSSAPSSSHIWSQHPEWRLKKANGSTQPLGSGYVTFNPALPEVQQHMANVVSDIASNYAVDGVHLDYIRMIGGAINDGYMADSTTVNLYRNHYGYAPGSYVDTKSYHYKSWVAAQITKIVDKCDDALKAAKPNADLSAATWANPISGSSSYQQDADWWVQYGNVDAAMQMNYAYSDTAFQRNFDRYPSQNNRQAALISGIGVYLKDQPTSGGSTFTVSDMISQLNYTKNNGGNGYQMFSYGDLVNSDGSLNSFGRALRDYNRNLIRERAQMNTIESFESGSGYFNKSVTYSGSSAGVTGGSTEIVNDGHLGNSAQKVTVQGSNSGWKLRHVAGKGKIAAPEGNQEFLAEGKIGFWLKTSTQNMSASLIIDDPDSGERAVWQSIVGDGQWHLYEWDLADAAQWTSFASGDGDIDLLQVTLDSLYFQGSGDAEFLIDTVAHNPFGSLVDIPEPTTLSLMLLSSLALLRRKKA